ncbi:hypothetical protein [Microbacterium sp.]|uniref:hypothetical protein n=1 Tax=Microbacterium sp. TaxID=51671 RepID=UPI003C776C1F
MPADVVSGPDEPRVVNSIQRFIDIWRDPALAAEVARQLTCDEVDALVALFSVVGRADLADTWIEAHSPGDDDGDAHPVLLLG